MQKTKPSNPSFTRPVIWKCSSWLGNSSSSLANICSFFPWPHKRVICTSVRTFLTRRNTNCMCMYACVCACACVRANSDESKDDARESLFQSASCNVIVNRNICPSDRRSSEGKLRLMQALGCLERLYEIREVSIVLLPKWINTCAYIC